MNLSSLLSRRLHLAAPPLLALLLTIALAGSTLAQQPPNSPGGPPSDPATNQPSTNPPANPPSSPPVNPPGTGPGAGPGSGPPAATPTPAATPAAANQMQPHPSAPFTPPADCIVAHAATPAQLCPIDGGLQYYFIGEDGSAQPGPWIRPFSELATLASASVYTGTNAKTGKSVTITYLAAENMIRVSTFYPDNQYDTNKPYNFTVDSSYAVNHEAW